ncbi:MAG: aminotransferase class I/II-fold pyridoxal phosphate-dependent enzyme [Myxococcales bacterium]|nr:aminotransferase class I/II-fold pyridoxal phosphate-dependent enzyme [Myxococcales bacterium]
MSLLRPALSELSAYVPHAAPAGVVRLDANESPPLDEAVVRSIFASAADVALERYPDARATRLRHAVARYIHAPEDSLLLGTGSDEVIGLLLSALSRPKPTRALSTCLYPTPTFVMYRVSAIAAGITPVGVPLDDQWDLDVPAMLRAIDEHQPNVLFLASPNNPTGNCYSHDRVARLVEHCAEKTLVVLDEAYGAFSTRDHRALDGLPNVARLGTLSKIGLAALRVGWASLPPALAAEVDKARQPFNVDAVAQRMAAEALEQHGPAIDAHARAIAHRRESLRAAVAALSGVTVFASDANFLWMDIGRDAAHVFEGLLRRGVLVRSFHSAGGRLARCLRVTVSTDGHNALFVDALRGTLATVA